MSRRSLRKKVPASEYLLGYVEDNEPIDVIMKKFKQLEEYQASTGHTALTIEDCEVLIQSTSLGTITSSFRSKYHFSEDSSSPSSSEGDAVRPFKYVDPVTQSYMQVDAQPGEGQCLTENVFTVGLQEQYQAVLVTPPEGLSLRLKHKLKYLKGAIKQGLIFLWSQKQEIKEWVEVLEKNKFQYIENLVWVKVDKETVERAGGLCALNDFTSDFLVKEPSAFFSRSHSTLLMFKKVPSGKLELRHQRSCDVVFDFERPQNYVYHMIETLLPEAGVKLELFADGSCSRAGWVHIVHRDN